VIVVGYSDARIPWPIGKHRGQRARAAGVVYFGSFCDSFVFGSSSLTIRLMR
jgi:hypothetical protein